MRYIGEHVVVLGAGVAGLLAARVLADAFERVTVVERNPRPASATDRHGVPQDRHAHVLLPRGQEALEELFPGLARELADGGAVSADPGLDHRLTVGGHTLCAAASDVRTLQMSRHFLEDRLRDRIRDLPDVAFIDGCDAVGLILTDPPRRVAGARVICRTPSSAEQEIGADLVIDATGHGSRTPAWFDALGHQPPEEDEVQVRGAYASRYLRLPPGSVGAVKAIMVGPRPGLARGLALIAVEGDRWLLTLAGGQDNRPPTDSDGFLDFAGTVVPAQVHAAIEAAEPLGPVSTFRYSASRRRRYELLRRLPTGIVVTGDALCSFDPVYAQGITVAAMETLILRRCLAATRSLDEVGRRYFGAAAMAVNIPWRIAVAAELAIPKVNGRRTRTIRLLNAYIGLIQAAAARDTMVAQQFMRVVGLLDPPSRLMRPAIVARTLRPSH